MPAKKNAEQNDEIAFEKAIERLNAIADALENKNPSLEEALTLYEEGASLLSLCTSKLKEAEVKIKELSKE